MAAPLMRYEKRSDLSQSVQYNLVESLVKTKSTASDLMKIVGSRTRARRCT